MSEPLIEDGAVIIQDDRITAVGRWDELRPHVSATVEDLGDVVLMPGLINAHCHLDYTSMAGKIPQPRSFADWIKAIVTFKGQWTTSEFAESWKLGAQMLLRTGTTTVADVEAKPELLPQAWDETPLRVISFRELIQLKDPTEPFVKRAAAEWGSWPGSDRRLGLSPHAPYTTTSELLSVAAHQARERKWLLTTHVAESEQEFEMFLYKHGPLYDWLKSQRDMSDCGQGSPIRHLEHADYLGDNLLAVHVNYLWRDDAAILGKYGVSVVHCPRSHDYFRHLLFPRRELMQAGVNVCLGTDSLASGSKVCGKPPELSMFAEMRAFASKYPDVRPEEILEMATVNAAKALKREGELGLLRERAQADLIAVPFNGPSEKVHEALVNWDGPVRASMIDGKWAFRAD